MTQENGSRAAADATCRRFARPDLRARAEPDLLPMLRHHSQAAPHVADRPCRTVVCGATGVGRGGASAGKPDRGDRKEGEGKDKRAPPGFPGTGSSSGKGGDKRPKAKKAVPVRGGFGAGRGAGDASKAGQLRSKSSTLAVAEPETYISGPIKVELEDEITPTEFTDAPRWDTWCNHLSGEWVGVYSAYTPWAGLPEPVWMDDRGKYVKTVLTRCLEERGKGVAGGLLGGGAEDLLLRKLGRALTPAQLKELKLVSSANEVVSTASETSTAEAGDELTADGAVSEIEDESLEVEALTYNSQGVVVFNGGHYSAGPDYIGPPQFKMLAEDPQQGPGDGAGGQQAGADEEGEVLTAAPTTTSIVESALVDWGSRSRMRLKLTLRIGHQPGNEEVDVQVLRIILFREVWAGPPQLTSDTDVDKALRKLASQGISQPSANSSVSEPTSSAMGSNEEGSGAWGRVKEALREASLLPRAEPHQLSGSWSVFTVSATCIEENDLMTGEPVLTWIYQTNEDKQEWSVPEGMPSGDEGGAVYLPGGVVVSFSMQDMQDALEEDNGQGLDTGQPQSNGNGVSSGRLPRGLRLGMSWQLAATNQVLSVERDYDGAGVLRGVRHSTAVKGGWAGGRM